MLDRSFTPKEDYKTRKSTALAYANIYVGPEVEYFEKYPRLMSLIFVSMFYGFAQPLFFVLILIIFIVSYNVEKFEAIFFYRKPPMYDDTMSNTAVFFLKWCGFFYVAIGWWNVTNRQMFENEVVPLRWQADLDLYNHTIGSVMTGLNLIPFFTAIVLFVLLLSIDLWGFIKHFFVKQSCQDELDDIEDLPDFPRCLNTNQLNNQIMEEEMI